jgi:hypothetical protein
MLRARARFLLLAVALFVAATSCRADDDPSPVPSPSPSVQVKDKSKKTNWTAEVFRKNVATGGIVDMNLSSSKIQVVLMPRNGKLEPLVEVRGTYARPGWSLYVRSPGGKTKLSTENEFVVFAFLHARYSNLNFVAEGPDGEVETEELYVFAPEAQEFRIGELWGELLVSLGGAGFSYTQTGFTEFDSKTAVLGLNYVTPSWVSRWGWAADLNFTFLTVSSTPIHDGPELLQLKGDATYLAVPEVGRKWNLHLLAGLSYLTLLSNGAPFGFSSLIAPDLGLSAKRELKNDSAIVGSFHYVPISGIISFSEFGYDLTLGWTKTLKNLHRFEADMVISNYSWYPDSAVKIQSNLFSLRVGYTI